jgi:CRP-like cAMP-binding protein
MEKKSSSALHDINIREYRPKEIIVSEADPCDRFFVILKGEVEIFQNNKSIRILKEGDIFGLENFYLIHPYTTSAHCLSTARIATYPVKLIKDIIYNRPQLTEKILQSVMTQLEQTTQIAEEHIPRENVVDITITELVFHDGDIVIEEGTNGCDIFQLIESEKGLLVTRDGTEVGKISTPGEYFGEISAILKQQRSATVRSLGRSVVKVFSGENLDTILTTYPHLARVIIDTLAKRLIAANAIISERGASPGA